MAKPTKQQLDGAKEESVRTPDITEFSCYFADDYSFDEKIKLGLFGDRKSFSNK